MLQKRAARVIAEQIGAPDVSAQGIDALVSADFHQFEDRGAALLPDPFVSNRETGTVAFKTHPRVL